MAQAKYAFIIKAPGYAMPAQGATLESPEFHTQIVGVSAQAEALAAVDRLVAEGTEIIELCGAFSLEDTSEIQVRAGEKVSVGVVTYPEYRAGKTVVQKPRSLAPRQITRA